MVPPHGGGPRVLRLGRKDVTIEINSAFGKPLGTEKNSVKHYLSRYMYNLF
jgi:hypothetical protein